MSPLAESRSPPATATVPTECSARRHGRSKRPRCALELRDEHVGLAGAQKPAASEVQPALEPPHDYDVLGRVTGHGTRPLSFGVPVAQTPLMRALRVEPGQEDIVRAGCHQRLAAEAQETIEHAGEDNVAGGVDRRVAPQDSELRS